MNESEQQLREEPIKPRTPKLSAEKALPRSGADTLVKIIKGYAVSSNGGETQVNYKDVASAVGISPNVVSGNNSFLLESQILLSPKYGFYLPSENAVRFARESAWDEAGAKAHLRKIVLDCWFGQVVIQNFSLRSTLTKEDMKRALAIKSGAAEGDANSLEYLIDFIIYTGLILENENGSLAKGSLDGLAKATTPQSETTSKSLGERESPQDNDGVPSQPTISLVVHLHINNLNDLTADHATRLMGWLRTLQAGQHVPELRLEEGKIKEDS